jgi:hypothetical protein
MGPHDLPFGVCDRTSPTITRTGMATGRRVRAAGKDHEGGQAGHRELGDEHGVLERHRPIETDPALGWIKIFGAFFHPPGAWRSPAGLTGEQRPRRSPMKPAA